MKYQIKNRFTGSVIFEADIECNADASEALKLGLSVRLAVKARADLARANLAGANLAGADLADANLADAYLVGANLADAYLARANLAGADLAGANLADAYLVGAYLARANLAGADLARANLAGAYLARAYLARANLAGADLADAYLADAYLVGAKWRDGITITRTPLQLCGLQYPVTILDAHMQIGCELHTFDEWDGFDDDCISRMDGVSSRRFWRYHKAVLMALCRSRVVKASAEAAE